MMQRECLHFEKPTKRAKSLALFVLGWVLLMGWSSAPSLARGAEETVAKAPAKTASTPLRIQGRVLQDDGTPLRGANVRLLPQSVAQAEAEQRWRGVRSRVAASMISGEDGRYELITPDAGFWLLEVSLPGYATQRYELTPLADHAVLPDVTLTPEEGFTLRVSDSKGNPTMARFSVLMDSEQRTWMGRFRTSGGSQWTLRGWEGRTDSQGIAKIPLSDDGNWKVTVVAAGHEPVQVSLKETTAVRLQPAGDRIADVVLADGRAAAGTYVYLEDGGPPIAKTDAEGRAELSLSMEEHALVWWHPSGQQASSVLPAVDPNEGTGDGQGEAGQEIQRVELKPSLLATGRVLEAKERTGLGGAWVWATTAQGLLISRSGGDGSYSMEVPFEGSAVIRAAASGYGMTIGQYTPPVLEDVAEGVQLTLLLEPTAGLQGQVVDAEGQPIEGVSARLEAGASRNMFSGQFIGAYRLQSLSDAQGRIEFRGLTAEQGYTLRLRKDGLAPAEFPVDALEAHQVRRDQRWTLSQGVRGVGQIVDQEDQPVVGAEVSLSPASTGSRMSSWFDSGSSDGPSGQSDREGRFSLPDLAPGRYDLEAKAPGFSRGVVRGLEVPEGGGDLDLGVLVLAPGVDLVGRVVDVDGVPLAGVEIMTSKGGDQRSRFFEMMGRVDQDAKAVSGEDGRFVVEDGTAGDQLNVTGIKEGFIQGVVRGVTLPRDKPIEIVLQRASSISGRVVDGDGSLLEGVTVTVVPADEMAARRARFGLGNSATTNVEGHFELDGVEPGANGLRAQKTGFQTLLVSGFEVPAEQPLDGVELQLQPGAELVGSVKDADGDPVVGGMIWVMDGNRGTVDGAFAQTDGDGAFQMSGLPLGKFIVTVRSGEGKTASKHLTIEEGENTAELVLGAGSSVGGQVVDALGAPVQGATVTLRSEERSVRAGFQMMESTADGSFLFEDVTAGDYWLGARKEGLGAAQLEETLQVTDTVIEGLQLRFSGGTRVVGRILGLSYDEMNRVEVAARGTGANEVSQPNFEGVFQVDHVQPGNLRITARLSGSSRMVQEQVVIEEGEVQVNVDLEFVDGYVLTGVVYKMGEPLDGLSLRLSKSGALPVMATTDGEGRFRFEGLEEADYVISTGGWGTSLHYEKEIELTADEDIRIDLEVARLAGQVVDDEGQPISKVRLALDRQGGRSLSETSDSLGQFDFGDTSPGVWELTARRSGYAGEPVTVELEAGQVKDDVRLEMRAVRGIVLEVTRQDGRPMSSVSAGFLGPSGAQRGGRIQGDDTGRFIVDTLADGSWNLVLAADGYGTTVLPVTAPSEDPVRVVLQPGGRLLVTVPALRDGGLNGILKLVSSTGQPYYSVQWSGQVEETFSLREGVRHLEGLTPGNWRVHVTGDDGSVWQGSVDVQAGEEASVELQ